eukprot:9592078-Lingulodinium_polyedra.AAC.1
MALGSRPARLRQPRDRLGGRHSLPAHPGHEGALASIGKSEQHRPQGAPVSFAFPGCLLYTSPSPRDA